METKPQLNYHKEELIRYVRKIHMTLAEVQI